MADRNRPAPTASPGPSADSAEPGGMPAATAFGDAAAPAGGEPTPPVHNTSEGTR